MTGQSTGGSVSRRIRHRAGPVIDRLAKRVTRPEYHVRPDGYVGTVRLSGDEFRSRLRDRGFGWDPVSFYHFTPLGESADGSYAYRSSLFADRQIHVVLFVQRSGYVDVYAHEEYNWVRHPRKHAAEENIDRDGGVSAMREWFDDADIPYDRRGRIRRRVDHAVKRGRRFVNDRAAAHPGRLPVVQRALSTVTGREGKGRSKS